MSDLNLWWLLATIWSYIVPVHYTQFVLSLNPIKLNPNALHAIYPGIHRPIRVLGTNWLITLLIQYCIAYYNGKTTFNDGPLTGKDDKQDMCTIYLFHCNGWVAWETAHFTPYQDIIQNTLLHYMVLVDSFITCIPCKYVYWHHPIIHMLCWWCIWTCYENNSVITIMNTLYT